jgi:hypothetical protein
VQELPIKYRPVLQLKQFVINPESHVLQNGWQKLQL